MATPRDNDDLSAAEFVIGLMPEAERARFAARLATEPQLAAAVQAWELRLAPLAGEVEAVAPPARLQAAIERSVFGETADTAETPGLWMNTAFWRSLALAAVGAMAVMAVFYFRAPEPSPGMLAEIAAADGKVRVIAVYDPRTGTLAVDRRAGEEAAGRSMQLWMIVGKSAPVSLGLMPGTATGSFAVAADLRAKMPDAVLAISDEPAGGSPTGQPTGAVLATGTVHSL